MSTLAKSEIRHFITVEWCANGARGVFCRGDGVAAGKDEPWTTEEMDRFLGPFALVLGPQSREISEAEMSRYERFVPLAEYSGEWGIAFMADVEAQIH